jgi:hypothetical protein
VAEERTTAGGGLEGSYPVFPTFTPDLGLPSHLRGPETEPDFSVLALPLVAVEEDTAGQTVLREETRIETLLQDNDEPEPLTPTDAAGPVISHWRDSLDLLIHSLEELVNHEPTDLPAEEANTETETYSGPPLEAAGQGSSSFSSPFRWEPKPAWLDVPSQPKPLSPNPADTRPPVYISRIPIRPLHKKPFYQRVLFYLRGWLRRIFEKTV